jgi:hypothetical protein
VNEINVPEIRKVIGHMLGMRHAPEAEKKFVDAVKSCLASAIHNGLTEQACEITRCIIPLLRDRGMEDIAHGMVDFLLFQAWEMEEQGRLLSASRILDTAGFAAKNILGDEKKTRLTAEAARLVAYKASGADGYLPNKSAQDKAEEVARDCASSNIALRPLHPAPTQG